MHNRQLSFPILASHCNRQKFTWTSNATASFPQLKATFFVNNGDRGIGVILAGGEGDTIFQSRLRGFFIKIWLIPKRNKLSCVG